MIDNKLEEKREQIAHNILSKYAKKHGLIKYQYPDGFYVFGNPDSQDMADKKHEEWLAEQKTNITMEQPKWCDYPNANQPFWGCWSLLDGLVINEDYCKNCDCYKKN